MTLHELLDQLHAALEAKDALLAETLMIQTVEAVSNTPNAAHDQRVLSKLKECDRLATAYHAELTRALQGSAQSTRAMRSYAHNETAP